jgi:proteasome assembly chaperone (PAC2) family protein
LVDLSASSDSPVHMVCGALIERARAEKVGELYSPYFPDKVISDETGLCRLPRLEIYASDRFTPNLIIVAGDPDLDNGDTEAHYEVAEALLNYAEEVGCRRAVACAAIRRRNAGEAVYVAASNPAVASSAAERLGGKPLSLGRITSPTGPLLGLAKLRGLDALCVVVVLGEGAGREAAATMLGSYLDNILELAGE